ncbi:transcription initiation factor TFIID subunit 6 [Skeletonema marinoi]|uniref:Transcription initiation factor TFIID subunit 6 n=1 Tax=Skeletonema marinoi TaxID=267567 RepID=A0AAD8YJ36_9STRA|nr:transcription initiation factor TFIID subunit 6 [Skeletonema marinoi]
MQAATQQTLANLVEAHVTALVRESAAVNRHSRRGGLISAADENNKSSSTAHRQKRRRLIHHDDINMALQWRGSEKLYVSGVSVPCVTQKSSNTKKAPKNALTQLLQNTTTTNTTVSSLLKASQVPRVDLNAYLQSELVIRPPSELGMTLHWLAVDGVSPMIPMNEVWNTQHSKDGRSTNNNNNGGLDPLAPVLDLDDDDEYENYHNNNNGGDTTNKSEASIRIRELQQRLLSEELKLYFSQVTSTIEHHHHHSSSSNNTNNHQNSEITTVLHGIRTDGGIQELVPFLSRFVASGLMNKKNLQNVHYCSRLIQVFDAMLDNPNLHLDLHLHQMFSPVGTCIVAKKLCNSPHEDHWSLREAAAQCLVKACDLYGMQYTTMKPRIMKLLTQQALRVDRPLATQYGGIVGISLFGPRAVDAFLLPVAQEYWECWEGELKSLIKNEGSSGGGGKKRDVWREYELHMCQQALLDAVAIFMRGVTPGEQAKRVDIESFSDVFGERLIPMQPEPTEYISAIL